MFLASLTNLGVTIEKTGDTPTTYTLPQTEVPLLKIVSYNIRQYKFSCSTDGSLKDLGKVTLTWKFIKYAKKPSAAVSYAMVPVQLKDKENGLQVVTTSLKQSNFTVKQPSSKLNGVYYCEWMASNTVQRSPAFEIRLEMGKS